MNSSRIFVALSCAAVALQGGCGSNESIEPVEIGGEIRGSAAALTRIAYAAADTLLMRQDNYLAACGYPNTVADYDKLPDRTVRGDPTKAIGFTSNGWELIEKFAAANADLASLPTKAASLWHRSRGGWEMFYLFRFVPGAPLGAGTANGVLAFKIDGAAVKGCAWDRLDAGAAPVDFHGLYYAGQKAVTAPPGGDPPMDDCSNCHIHAYVAPRPKTLAVARNKRFLWLSTFWKPAAARFAAAEKGVDWIVGPKDGAAAGGAYPIEGDWIGGTGANVAGSLPAGCRGRACHAGDWVEPASALYCSAVFDKTFDANGSMVDIGEKFATRADCRAMYTAVRCTPAITNAACGPAAGPNGPAIAMGPAPPWFGRNIAIAKSGPSGSPNEWDTVTLCWDAVTLDAPARVMEYDVIVGSGTASDSPSSPEYTNMIVDYPQPGPARITSVIDTASAFDPAAYSRNFDLRQSLYSDASQVWFLLSAQVDGPGDYTIEEGASDNPLSQFIRASDAVYGACELCGNGTLDALEACDDGNQVSGDGCSASCELEVDAGVVPEPDAGYEDAWVADAGYEDAAVPDAGYEDATAPDASAAPDACVGCDTCDGGSCGPVCGDLVCGAGEDCTSCPMDCGGCGPSCGNFACEPGEDCASCSMDCGWCGPTCGNFACEPGEDCASCSMDCGWCGPTCGDAICAAGEDCWSCSADCGPCGPACGDALCDGTEDCASCPMDCGPCAPMCGDALCDGTEDCASCPMDCGPCAPMCGDAICDGSEDCVSCPMDCAPCAPTCGDALCDGTEDCVSCPMDCGPCGPTCGDAICDGSEDFASCPMDCGPCAPTCGDALCDWGEDCATCAADCGACAPEGGDLVCGAGEEYASWPSE